MLLLLGRQKKKWFSVGVGSLERWWQKLSLHFLYHFSPENRSLHMVCGTEMNWNKLSADLYLTLNKRLRGIATWELDSIFYLKVVFNNHKSKAWQRNNLWFIWVTLSFLEWKDSFSYRNWKRSTPLFWTYSWHSFVNKSSKSQRCFPSLLSMSGYSAGNKQSCGLAKCPWGQLSPAPRHALTSVRVS